MLSNQLRRMTKGYTAVAKSQGYEPQAAEPIYSGKIKTLLQHWLQEQQHSTETDKLLLINTAQHRNRQATAKGWTDHQHAVAVLLQRLQCGGGCG